MRRTAAGIAFSVVAVIALACAGTGNFRNLSTAEREQFGRCRTIVAAHQCGDHYHGDDVYRMNCENGLASRYANEPTSHARARWLILNGCPRDMVGESTSGGGTAAGEAIVEPCPGSRVHVNGHCCLPGQRWRDDTGCFGTPVCFGDFVAVGESCVRRNVPTPGPGGAPALPDCNDGRARGPLTDGRCCWPAQSWNDARGRCVGPPSCPSGMSADGDSCVR